MKLLILLIALSANLAFAQKKLDANITSDTRYDSIEDKDNGSLLQNRYQQRVRIGFTYDINGKFQVIGLLSTGSQFGNDWDTFKDLNSGQKNPVSLAFRRLYLQMVDKNTTMQLGGLESFKLYGSGGVGNSGGWIDGFRVKQKTAYGNFDVVMGSVADPTNTDLFTRHKKLNFIEVEFSKEVFENLVLSTEYQHFDDGDNLGQTITFKPNILGKKVLTLIADGLYNFDHKATNYDLGFKWDALKTFNDQYDDRLNLDVYYNHMDAKLHDRNNLYGLYFGDGSYVTGGLNGRIVNSGSLRWFMRYSAKQEKSRFDVGVTLKL